MQTSGWHEASARRAATLPSRTAGRRASPAAGPAPRQTLLLAMLVSVSVAVALTFSEPNAMFLVFGAVACLIVSLPLMRTDYDVLSPWSLVVATVYIGCGLRSIFVAFSIDGSRTVNELFLLNQPLGFFIRPGLLYLAALILMVVGYSRVPNTSAAGPLTRYLTSYRFGPHLHLVVAVCAAIGLGSFYLYVQRTGFFSPSTLSDLTAVSAKRTTITGVDLRPDYESYGQLAALNEFGAIAFWLLLGHFAHSGQRHSLLTLRGLVLLGLFINASALPIYASTRADIAYLLLVAGAIELCLGRHHINRRVVIAAAAAVLMAITGLTFLRIGSESRAGADVSTDSLVRAAGDALVFNRTFSDIPTSAQIINAVPEVLPYEYGGTIAGWFTAAIPRSVWADKPLISSGPIIGTKVFGTERSGVPPGFVAEMYWNFGLVGVVIGSFLLGSLLRGAHLRLIPTVRASPAAAIFYCVVFFRIGGNAITGGVGYAAFSALVSAAFVMVALMAAGSSVKAREAAHGCPQRGVTSR